MSADHLHRGDWERLRPGRVRVWADKIALAIYRARQARRARQAMALNEARLRSQRRIRALAAMRSIRIYRAAERGPASSDSVSALTGPTKRGCR